MKKLNIPIPCYGWTDANWIIKDLAIKLAKSKRADEKLTLYGAYKNMRAREAYGALGDYVILSQTIIFFQDNGLDLSEREVRKCLNYFEDYNAQAVSRNKVLTRSLMGCIEDNPHDTRAKRPIATLRATTLALA